MALGSWQGLYNHVIDDLMDQQREQELLLLMAIARFADPLGFAFPGRARLEARRRVSKKKHLERENWLIEQGLLAVENVYNLYRRQEEPHYQISPYALYVREEFMDYCEAVFTSQKVRDFVLEENLLVTLSREKESQPDNQNQKPEPEPDAVPRRKTRESNQTPPSKKAVQGATTGNVRQTAEQAKNQPPAGPQAAPTQNRKKQPAGGVSGDDEFSALLSPTIDDDRIVSEICHVVSTTRHQAAGLVRVYPREAIVHWLRIAGQRRQKGELANPGGWFFKMLQSQTPLPIEHWPLWAQQQKAAKSGDDDLSELDF